MERHVQATTDEDGINIDDGMPAMTQDVDVRVFSDLPGKLRLVGKPLSVAAEGQATHGNDGDSACGDGGFYLGSVTISDLASLLRTHELITSQQVKSGWAKDDDEVSSDAGGTRATTTIDNAEAFAMHMLSATGGSAVRCAELVLHNLVLRDTRAANANASSADGERVGAANVADGYTHDGLELCLPSHLVRGLREVAAAKAEAAWKLAA